MANNKEMVELWNGEASAAWSNHPERYDAMLRELGLHALDAAHLEPGERVLDIGCGAGQLTLQAAEIVGPDGSVLGVDVAAGLLAVARGRANEAGLAQIELVQADAQDHAFPAGSYDVVLSRFGVMFFEDPVSAFANLKAATRPGGRLAFVAWQPAPLNEWATVPLFAAMAHVGAPDLPEPGAPGPFAFGDADRLRTLLTEAGWADVMIEGFETTLSVGGARTAAEAVDFISADTFGQRFLHNATPEQRAGALQAMRDAYEAHLVDGEVRVKAAAWIVTARRPAG
jgi:ubiquinone/menaquinone biosynthesis C-methylase UbiE